MQLNIESKFNVGDTVYTPQLSSMNRHIPIKTTVREIELRVNKEGTEMLYWTEMGMFVEESLLFSDRESATKCCNRLDSV